MKNSFFLALLFVSLFFNSCTKEKNTGNSGSAQTLFNVAYGSSSAQAMDIYLPANRNTGSTKVIVLIHGGGWISGDKNDPLFLPTVDKFSKVRFPSNFFSLIIMVGVELIEYFF